MNQPPKGRAAVPCDPHPNHRGRSRGHPAANVLRLLIACLWFTSSAWAYYNPALGRWLNRDPAGETGGPNLVGFTGNQPVTRVDPFGLRTDHVPRDLQKYRICRRASLVARLTDGGVEPGDVKSDCCEIVTIIVKLPGCTASGSDGKGLGGHTGLGIGNQFYDYGPARPVTLKTAFTGVPGSQWWDDPGFGLWNPDLVRSPDDILLSDILDSMTDVFGREPYGPQGAPRDVFKVELAVPPREAKTLQEDWEHRYQHLGSYRLLGDQCTTTVMKSLDHASIFDRPWMTFKPQGFLESLRNATHLCGPNQGRRAKITRISAELEPRNCPLK